MNELDAKILESIPWSVRCQEFSVNRFNNPDVELGLKIIEDKYPELAGTISHTKQGDKGLFSEEDVLHMVEICHLIEAKKEIPREGTISSNFLAAYAEFRWGEPGKTLVSVEWRSREDHKWHRENIAAKLWWRFTGENEDDRNLKRARFYMNLDRDEATQYANDNFFKNEDKVTIVTS